jgi:hypothetical protein
MTTMRNLMRQFMNIINEEIDVAATTVSHQFASWHRPDQNRYVFTIPLGNDAFIKVFCEVNAETLDFVDIQIDGDGADEHPDAFTTTNKGWYSNGIRIGAGDTRRVLRYVVDQVRQDHPAIKHLTGERVTGARNKTGKRVLNIRIP